MRPLYKFGFTIFIFSLFGCHQLVNGPWAEGFVGQVSFSPDGSRLLFVSQMPREHPKFGIYDFRSRKISYISNDGLGGVFSPDGKWVVYGTGQQIYKMKPDGTGVVQITNGEGKRTDPRFLSDLSKFIYSCRGLRYRDPLPEKTPDQLYGDSGFLCVADFTDEGAGKGSDKPRIVAPTVSLVVDQTEQYTNVWTRSELDLKRIANTYAVQQPACHAGESCYASGTALSSDRKLLAFAMSGLSDSGLVIRHRICIADLKTNDTHCIIESRLVDR